MGVRDRLLVVVLLTVAIALVTMTVAFNVLLGVLLASDVDDRLDALVTDASRSLRIVEGGGISLPRPTGDIKELGSQIWVFAAGKAVSTPAVDPDIEAAAKALQDQPYTYVDVPDHNVRLLGEPLMDSQDVTKRIGTVVAGLDMGSYARVQRMALLGTVSFTALMLLIVGLTGQWALNAAFRPVSRMTAEAEAWSTSDLDKRFEMGDPHDELTQLAHTLDALLDRLAASLRRERLFSAEISHQLRTPVAKIKAEAELALRRERDPGYYEEALRSVVHSADEMASTVETLLAAAREAGGLATGRADAGQVLEDVAVSVRLLARREQRGGVGRHPGEESGRGRGGGHSGADSPPGGRERLPLRQQRGPHDGAAKGQRGPLRDRGRRTGRSRRREGTDIRARRAWLGGREEAPRFSWRRSWFVTRAQAGARGLR